MVYPLVIGSQSYGDVRCRTIEFDEIKHHRDSIRRFARLKMNQEGTIVPIEGTFENNNGFYHQIWF